MIGPSQSPLPYNKQHSQQTDTYADGGIRTRNSSKWAAETYALARRAVVFKIISLKNADLKCVTVMWDMSLTPSQKVLSTDEEMIPARNVTTEHARDFVANEELLLPILKAFAQYTRSLLATGNEYSWQSVCIRGTVCSCQRPFSSPPPHYSQQSPAPRQTCLPPHSDHLFFCGLWPASR